MASAFDWRSEAVQNRLLPVVNWQECPQKRAKMPVENSAQPVDNYWRFRETPDQDVDNCDLGVCPTQLLRQSYRQRVAAIKPARMNPKPASNIQPLLANARLRTAMMSAPTMRHTNMMIGAHRLGSCMWAGVGSSALPDCAATTRSPGRVPLGVTRPPPDLRFGGATSDECSRNRPTFTDTPPSQRLFRGCE